MRPDTQALPSPSGRAPATRRLLGLAVALGVLATGALAALTAAPAPAAAQQVQRIAAVVNDQVISLYDLMARLELAIRSSELPDTQETRQRLVPTVLQQLIDDRLKMQEAERLRITVTEEDLRGARSQIERNNKMPPGTLNRFLAQPGIDENSFNAQLRAEIAWIKVAQTHLRRTVSVEPEEIDAVLDSLRRTLGKPERLLAEIVLSVESPDQEDQVRSVAERLRSELLQGAPFQAVARQFSSAPTAGSGGDLGWVVEGALDPSIEAALEPLSAGQITAPIRTATGYHVMLLRERRNLSNTPASEVPLTLAQLFMPLSGPAAVPAERRQEALSALSQGSATCADIDRMAGEMQVPSSGMIGTLKPGDLPAEVREAVLNLEEGRISRPIRLGDTAEVLIMVCQRHSPTSLPPRDAVEARLEAEKLERVAQRALRNLRRSALIDIRL